MMLNRRTKTVNIFSIAFVIVILILTQFLFTTNQTNVVKSIEEQTSYLGSDNSNNDEIDYQTNSESNGHWWDTWTRDTNRNRIDDQIEYKMNNKIYSQSEKLIVILDYDHKPSEKDVSDITENGGEVIYVTEYIDSIIAKVYFPTIQQLLKRPEVVMVEDNSEFTVTLDTSVPAIGADTVKRSLNITGRNVVIAFLDTGIDATHVSLDDLDDNLTTNDPKVIGWYDVVNGRPAPYDDYGHGTHCAGIAAGTGGPKKKYVGVAPGAKLVGIKVLNSNGVGTSVDIIVGIEWAIKNKNIYGIRIMSMSFGGIPIPFITNDGKSAVSRDSNRAVENGIVVTVAAGNAGPMYVTVGPPGDAIEVITVGSVNDNHILSRFSSRGPVGEPWNTYIKPDVTAPGEDVVSAWANTKDGFVSESGTSMSTPHAAGVAALILEANNTLTANDVKSLITKNAGKDKKWPLQRTPNNDYGWGVIDAYATVKEVIEKKNSTIDSWVEYNN